MTIPSVVLSKLPDLAQVLLDLWARDGSLSLPTKTELQKGLAKLLGIGALSLAENFAPQQAVDLVTAAIKRFEKADFRPQTGILDRKLFSRLLAPICNDWNVPLNATQNRVTDPSNVKFFTVRYFVDDSVDPAIQGHSTISLIASASQLWKVHAKLLVIDHVMDRTHANVVISMKPIDGVGGVLGRANVAGPGKFDNLSIVMDKREDWSPDLFTAAICHEFGHILGLAHSRSNNQLMSPVIPNNVFEPQAQDVAEIQRIYLPIEPFTPRPVNRKFLT